MPTVKKVPLGRAIVWTQTNLQLLSDVSYADILEAKKVWHRLAHPRYKKLLDATETESPNAESEFPTSR